MDAGAGAGAGTRVSGCECQAGRTQFVSDSSRFQNALDEPMSPFTDGYMAIDGVYRNKQQLGLGFGSAVLVGLAASFIFCFRRDSRQESRVKNRESRVEGGRLSHNGCVPEVPVPESVQATCTKRIGVSMVTSKYMNPTQHAQASPNCCSRSSTIK